MNYKHCCVVDADGAYKTFVLVLLVEGENGETAESVQHYKLVKGEQLIDANPPTMRPYAGAAGLISPKWDVDTSAWIEAATGEEIAAWEAEHPDPNAKTLAEEKAERIQQSKADLEAYLEAHPITWTDGETYSITQEKQNQLMGTIAAAQIDGQPPEWNTTGGVCRAWDLTELCALAVAIKDRVKALVKYQQAKEVAMREATTLEELEGVNVDYDEVS